MWYDCTCGRCDHRWTRNTLLKRCPSCKAKDWEDPIPRAKGQAKGEAPEKAGVCPGCGLWKRVEEHDGRECRACSAHHRRLLSIRRRYPTAEGAFTSREWQDLLLACGFACCACGASQRLHADHVHPLNKGGSNAIENIRPLCWRCNFKKGQKAILNEFPRGTVRQSLRLHSRQTLR